MTRRHTLATCAKLGLAGATITTIAWAVITFYPSPQGVEVKASQADIGDFFATPVSRDHKFADALQRLGHEPPRLYNHNGNDLYFSTRTINKRPYELLREYQSEFVHQKINERGYLESDMLTADDLKNPSAHSRGVIAAMLSDQIVPTAMDDENLIMSSTKIAGDPTTAMEFAALSTDPTAQRPFEETFKNYRYIESNWDADSQSSSVTAVWGGANFDVRRALRTGGAAEVDQRPNQDVPACLGCTRVMNFETVTGDAPMSTQMFATSSDPDTVRAFYQRALAHRGWRETEASSLMHRALRHTTMQHQPHRMMQFTRGGEFLTMSIDRARAHDRTFISTIVSP